MSEVQSRPTGSRGRGSFRGGRGGYRGSRGASKAHRNEDQENMPPQTAEEEGEIGELKKQYGTNLVSLREMFPGWSDEDLVYALKETDGDVERSIEGIMTGSISQWQESTKKQSKSKEAIASSADTTTAGRGVRGRGGLEGRGRGRGTDRGRGARGGRAGSHANGTRTTDRAAKESTEGFGDTPAATTETIGGWDAPTNGDTAATGDWANDTSAEAAPASAVNKSEPKTEPVTTTKVPVSSWNKLFEKPKAPPVPKQVPVPKPEEPVLAPTEEMIADERLPPPPTDPQDFAGSEEPLTSTPDMAVTESNIHLTPSKDELTETNLEQLPDTSRPPATITAASTTASTQDPRNASLNAAPAVRPGMGISGYAANAARATSGAPRSASFVRKVMEQQEAVVMPGNHAVDRAAVQFGSMGLNGDQELEEEDREDPETRTQLPEDSPVAPRASLPPGPPPIQSQRQAAAEMPTAPRQAPGLPPAPQQPSASPQHSTAYADQFARYGQSGQQKAYDPFGQQHAQQHQAPTQAQEPFGNQTQSQTQQIPSSAPNDYSAYYTTSQQRDAAAAAYQNYYANYGQSQEAQQRSGSAFGTSAQDSQSQYATSRPQPSYAQQETQNSGDNTPNPALHGQQGQQSHQMHHGQGSHGGYPYGYPNAYSQQYPQYGGNYMNQMGSQGHRYGQHRPMFDDVRRQGGDDYYSQYGYGHGQQQYGGSSYNKSNMYGQPQHQYSYEHSASPANAGSFGQSALGGRDAMYGRTGSAQPSEAQQSASTPFGGMNDPFARTHSGFGSQAPGMSQQHSGQQGTGDTGKEYDSGKLGGPSPSIAAANRPGSAANMPGQQQASQTGYPAQQSQQASQNAFGSFPQYGGGLGGYGGHHQAQTGHHQNTGYGSYGAQSGFGGSYNQYGSGSGRGWNGSYGGAH